MAASIIDGKGIALRVREGLAPRVEALKSRGITPGLAVVLVGRTPPRPSTCATRSARAKSSA